jgi:cell wall-associated NlpC family hydrolase
MAAEAEKRGLPPELPVMASLVESDLKNLNFGDADSVGFFQMRVGIWNQGEYAGYPDDPAKQVDWFLDHAAAVKAQRVASGLSVDDPKQFGEWIADVERPAEQYRGRYQLRFDEARELLAGSRRRAPVEDVADQVGGRVRAGPSALAAVAEAKKYLGTPYQWGGSSPQTGFDCSGLVQWAYAQEGIRIPRVTDQQILAENATKVGRNHLLPGDLVFFRDDTGYVHHVGISLGGKRFLHAPHNGDVVKISSLKEPYYREQFTGGRRFDDAVHPAKAGPEEVTAARAALARDADEVGHSGTALFQALERQEASKNNEVQVLPAITRDQVRR